MPGSIPRERRRRCEPGGLRGRCVAAALAVLVCGACAEEPLEEAIALQSAGHHAASLEILSRLLDEQEGPADPAVLYHFGVALTATGNASQAIWSLREAMQSPEWLIPASQLLARNALRAENPELVIDVMDQVLEVRPDHVPSLEMRAQALLTTRRAYDRALEDAERILELDPGSVSGRVAKVVALLALERADEAEPLIAEMESFDLAEDLGAPPDPITATWCLGRAQFAEEKGEAERATAIYAECVERYPANPEVIRRRLENLDRNGMHDEALAFLAETYSRLRRRDYRTSLVRRLEALGRSEEADRILLGVIEEAKNSPVIASAAWEDLAGLRTARGEQEAGLEAFERAVALAPVENPLMLFAYAEALVDAKRLDRAEAVASRIGVQVYREMALGRVLLARGAYAAALERFSQGNLLWPNNAPARFYAALAAEGAGDFERAKEEYRAAIRSDISGTDARRRLAELHAADGEYAAANSALSHGRRGAENWPLEDGLYQMELYGRAATPAELFSQNAIHIGASPEHAGRAVARYAAGTRASRGPAEAAQVVLEADALDLLEPRNAPALRSLVTDLIALDRHAEAREHVTRALNAQPDAAEFQEVLGLLLEAEGRDAEALAAFERALALAPRDRNALLGLARQRRARGESEAALALLERATALQDRIAEPELARAELLIELDRGPEAEAALADLLERQPTEWRAALRLAQLRAERDAPGLDRTLALAQRAQRFGAGPEADELVEALQTAAPAGRAPAAS